MAAQCNTTFDGLARSLGFTCHDAPAIIHLRNPFALSNWTLPVLELMMVAGAALALWWAIRRLRRDGDPTLVVLWFASVVYLLVVEIPLYFPDTFGVEGPVGVVFAHNVFTVQFLYDRLPLYIVALYPAVTVLAFEIVRVLGVFRRRGILLGAVCVAFVYHVFYEVFDQLGPQLQWWMWNTENPINRPMLSSVPVASAVIFATFGPAVVTALVLMFVGRRVEQGKHLSGPGLVLRTLVVGALVPVGITILGIPSSVFGGNDPNTTAQAIVFAIELALIAAVSVPILIRAWLHTRDGDPAPPNQFVDVFGPVYLGVLAVLWVCALPAYFSAVDGITRDGTPIGNLPYASVCFAAASLCTAAAITATRQRNLAMTSPANRSIGAR